MAGDPRRGAGVNTAALPVPDADRKRKANLAALLALHGGYELRELSSGEFLISKWGLQRFCRSLSEAEDFARAVGALQ